MALSRKEYVEICQTCTKRQFDKKLGLICSLTGQQAAFEIECPDIEIDDLAIQRIERMERHKEEMQDRSTGGGGFFSAEKSMLNSGAWGGVGMIVVGVGWLVIGFMNDWLFYYPIFMIIAGIVVLIRASIKKAQELNKPDTSDILDDQDDMEVI